MSSLKLVAEIGGYAGLLLGVSFYHIIKMLEYLLDWFLKGNSKIDNLHQNKNSLMKTMAAVQS